MAMMYAGGERRYLPLLERPELRCRLCFEPIELNADGVEVTPMFAFYRCPHCRGSFRIRDDDLGLVLRDT